MGGSKGRARRRRRGRPLHARRGHRRAGRRGGRSFLRWSRRPRRSNFSRRPRRLRGPRRTTARRPSKPWRPPVRPLDQRPQDAPPPADPCRAPGHKGRARHSTRLGGRACRYTWGSPVEPRWMSGRVESDRPARPPVERRRQHGSTADRRGGPTGARGFGRPPPSALEGR